MNRTTWQFSDFDDFLFLTSNKSEIIARFEIMNGLRHIWYAFRVEYFVNTVRVLEKWEIS